MNTPDPNKVSRNGLLVAFIIFLLGVIAWQNNVLGVRDDAKEASAVAPAAQPAPASTTAQPAPAATTPVAVVEPYRMPDEDKANMMAWHQQVNKDGRSFALHSCGYDQTEIADTIKQYEDEVNNDPSGYSDWLKVAISRVPMLCLQDSLAGFHWHFSHLDMEPEADPDGSIMVTINLIYKDGDHHVITQPAYISQSGDVAFSRDDSIALTALIVQCSEVDVSIPAEAGGHILTFDTGKFDVTLLDKVKN